MTRVHCYRKHTVLRSLSFAVITSRLGCLSAYLTEAERQGLVDRYFQEGFADRLRDDVLVAWRETLVEQTAVPGDDPLSVTTTPAVETKHRAPQIFAILGCFMFAAAFVWWFVWVGLR